MIFRSFTSRFIVAKRTAFWPVLSADVKEKQVTMFYFFRLEFVVKTL